MLTILVSALSGRTPHACSLTNSCIKRGKATASFTCRSKYRQHRGFFPHFRLPLVAIHAAKARPLIGLLFFLILSGSFVFPGESVQAEAPAVWTLNQVYLEVLKRSEQDDIRQEDLAIAESRYRQSLSSYYPEIFLFGRKNWYDRFEEEDNPQLQAIIQQQQNQGNTSGSGNGGNAFRELNPYQVGAGFRWPIFSGFQTYHENQARDAERMSARLNRQRFRELLFRDVGEVYFQILEYQKTLEILREEQQALLARIGELARRVNIGRSSQGELLAARSEYSNSRVELERIQGLRQISLELLAFLMGQSADTIQLAPPGKLPEQEALAVYLDRVEDRKDLKAAFKALEAQKSRLDVEKGGHYPQASVEGNYYTTQKPDFGRDWGITLSIEVPIFQGGQTYYAVKESRALARKSELELKSLKRSASYEVRSAYVDYVNSLSRLALLRQSVDIGRATYFVQLRDYRLGIVSNLEVLNALRGYHAARRELTRIEMLVRMNEIRLHVAAGMESNIPDAPPEEDQPREDSIFNFSGEPYDSPDDSSDGANEPSGSTDDSSAGANEPSDSPDDSSDGANVPSGSTNNSSDVAASPANSSEGIA